MFVATLEAKRVLIAEDCLTAFFMYLFQILDSNKFNDRKTTKFTYRKERRI